MKDPVEARADESHDLYDITRWEPRTALDRLAVRAYRLALYAGGLTLVVLGVAILLVLVVAGGIGAAVIEDPYILGLVILSVVPAGLLALYIYLADITTAEPPVLLTATFILAILFAGFASIFNAMFGWLRVIPFVGIILFFYLIVGPVEEAVKLLAVRLYAYRSDRFNSVIDGAVYGAVAGLGFATIENALYITQNLNGPGTALTLLIAGTAADVIGTGGQITALRSLAGPGHVIYSAIAGYYLGLAKFNRENAGPIVAKGLLIAAFIHATYNTLVGIVPAIVSLLVPGVPLLVLFFGFVVVYDGLFGYILYRKFRRYRQTYREVHAEPGPQDGRRQPELAEFDPDRRIESE